MPMTKDELIAALKDVPGDMEVAFDVWRSGILQDTAKVRIEGVTVFNSEYASLCFWAC
jgi:hypothetical protein